MDGFDFTSAEHALLYSKASLMGDVLRAKEIREAKDAVTAKKLGDEVRPWHVWK